MGNFCDRTILAIGETNYLKIQKLNIIIFGVGGVGGAVAEYLARLGVEQLTIVDADCVNITNLNRQIIALHSSISLDKVDVIKNRLLDINPNIKIHTIKQFIHEEDIPNLELMNYDYIVDAIDTVSTKLAIIEFAIHNNLRIISSMGAGNRIDPSKIKISDISKTEYDPLAKVIRTELRKRNINHVKVCYTTELPFIESKCIKDEGRNIPGSVSYIPNIFGGFISSEILKDTIKTE